MGHTFKTKLSWTPRGYDRTLSTDLNLSVGGLPTEIRVTKLPDKMDYKDGETFNPTGIIVHAYYEDGSDYGTVLNSELSYDPMKISTGGGDGDIYSKDGVHAVSVYHSLHQIGGYTACTPSTPYNPPYRYGILDEPGIVYLTQYNGVFYACVPHGAEQVYMLGYCETGWYGHGYVQKETQPGDFLFAECYDRFDDYWKGVIPTSEVNPKTVDFENAKTGEAHITVIWHRPSDGATLTCPLTVNVEPKGDDPDDPEVPPKTVGGNDSAVPAQAHSGDKTITNATYPNASSVGNDAFNGCNNLKTVNVSNATTIGDRAFADCGRLTSVTDTSITETT